MAKCLLVDFINLGQTKEANTPLEGFLYANLGLPYISAVLKKRGHETSALALGTRFTTENPGIIARKLSIFRPDIVAITCMFNSFHFACHYLREFRKYAPFAKYVIGGPHVTLNPEEASKKDFDIICVGEGEYPMAELAAAIDQGGEIPPIRNLWIKRDCDEWERNPPRNFIEDLDALPFPDNEMWMDYIIPHWQEVKFEQFVILLGRGCPFNCTFCSNHSLKLSAQGKYVRMHSPQSVVEEIKQLKARHTEIVRIYLEVETIGADLKQLFDLCSELKKLNKNLSNPLEFSANFRVAPGLDFNKIFESMANAGFIRLNLGLESGSERVRKEIMNRNYSNQLFLDVIKALRENGLKFRINNMVGLPGETYKEYLETVRINRICLPDECNIQYFEPYPGTKLYEVCKKLGAINTRDYGEHSRTRASLDFKEFSRKKIQFAWIFFEAKVFWGIWPLHKLIKLTYYKIIITYPRVGNIIAKIYGFFCVCRNIRTLLRDYFKV